MKFYQENVSRAVCVMIVMNYACTVNAGMYLQTMTSPNTTNKDAILACGMYWT